MVYEDAIPAIADLKQSYPLMHIERHPVGRGHEEYLGTITELAGTGIVFSAFIKDHPAQGLVTTPFDLAGWNFQPLKTGGFYISKNGDGCWLILRPV